MAMFVRERLRRHGLQQVPLKDLAQIIEGNADLFMPTSLDEVNEWRAEVEAAQADYALADSPFRDFGVTQADALASWQTIHDTLTGAAHHEVAHRFEGWRVVVVGVDPTRGLRLITLDHLSDER